MSDDRAPESRGGDTLARISDEMVRAKKQFFGKGPEQAKSYMLDDMLIVVMRGGLTTAEQTMLDFGEQNLVRQFRQLFENRMTQRLTSLVEDATGRTVVNYQSQIMFDPDIIVEMFVLDQPHDDGVETTARGQLRDEEIGATTESRAGNEPSATDQ